MLRWIAPPLAAVFFSLPAAAADEPLTPARIIGAGPNSGDVLLGALKLGKRSGGVFSLTAPITGPVDAATVGGTSVTSILNGFLAGQQLAGILRSQIGQVPIPSIIQRFTVAGCTAAGDSGRGSDYVRGSSSGPMAVKDGAGAWWELARVGVLDAGAYCLTLDGTGDNSAALQASATQAVAWGAKLRLPPGTIRYTTGPIIDVSGTTDDIGKRFEVEGAGRGLTVLRLDTTSPTACGLTLRGGSGFANHANGGVRDLMIAGVTGNGRGVCGSRLADLTFTEIFVQGLTHGYYLQDVLSSRWFGGTTTFNFRGLYAERTTSSGPNAFSFFGHRCGNNNINCMKLVDGAGLNYVGGSIEGNGLAAGSDPDRGGIILTTPGLEGGVAANISSYIEQNGGPADIRLTMGAVHPVVLNVGGSLFNRVRSEASGEYTTNNILVEGPAGAAAAVVNAGGASFRGLGPYTPSASRPYIASTSLGPVTLNDAGAFYAAAVEHPPIPTGRILGRVRFDGTQANGTLLLKSASGVTSVSKSSAGTYLITLAETTASTAKTATVFADFPVMVQQFGQNLSQVQIRLFDLSGTARDTADISIIVYDQ